MGDAITVTDDVSGAPKTARIKALASNNATLLKAGPGNVYSITVTSGLVAAVSTAFLKFYDKASTPAPASDTQKFTIPLINTASANAIIEVTIPHGLAFTVGIGYAIVLNVGDTDNTSAVADSVHGFVLFR